MSSLIGTSPNQIHITKANCFAVEFSLMAENTELNESTWSVDF